MWCDIIPQIWLDDTFSDWSGAIKKWQSCVFQRVNGDTQIYALKLAGSDFIIPFSMFHQYKKQQNDFIFGDTTVEQLKSYIKQELENISRLKAAPLGRADATQR